MSLIFKNKTFQELSLEELYQLLRLRCEVFVVEQNCVYQDIDDKDQKAIHLLGFSKGILVAYSRLFQPGDYFKQASIGRVIIKESYRNKKWGVLLMEESIRLVEEDFQLNEITLSAQLHLKEFYESLGFECVGESYLEDGIPHIEMYRKSI
ncbi:MAG: GNAT family N-acetyltransferase [Flavobacterium sp.]